MEITVMDSVPSVVRDQLAEAEAEFERDNADTSQETPLDGETSPETQPEPDAPTETPPEGETDPEAQPEPQPEGETPPAGEDASRQEVAAWEARYNALNGKYLAEVPRLQRQLKVMQDELAALKRQPGQGGEPPAAAAQPGAAESRLQQPAAAPSATDPDNPYNLTEAEREYGDEIISLSEKIARGIANREVGAVQTQQAQQGFIADLGRLVPDWESVNAQEAFVEFCDSVEPNSGLAWQEILNAAQAGGDPVRVAHVFNAFKSKNGATKPPASAAQATLAEQQSRIQPGQANTPPGPRTFKAAEYERLMINIGRGMYTPKKAAEITAELEKAYSEGRIVEG